MPHSIRKRHLNVGEPALFPCYRRCVTFYRCENYISVEVRVIQVTYLLSMYPCKEAATYGRVITSTNGHEMGDGTR